MQQMHYHKKVYCSRVKGNVILEQLIERQSLLFCKKRTTSHCQVFFRRLRNFREIDRAVNSAVLFSGGWIAYLRHYIEFHSFFLRWRWRYKNNFPNCSTPNQNFSTILLYCFDQKLPCFFSCTETISQKFSD